MSHCQNLGELVILADGRQTMNRDLCGHGHFFMDDHSTSLFDHDIFIYIYKYTLIDILHIFKLMTSHSCVYMHMQQGKHT